MCRQSADPPDAPNPSNSSERPTSTPCVRHVGPARRVLTYEQYNYYFDAASEVTQQVFQVDNGVTAANRFINCHPIKREIRDSSWTVWRAEVIVVLFVMAHRVSG